MSVYPEKPTVVTLQTLPQEVDGSPKTNISTAEVRVYKLVSGIEQDILTTTALVQDGFVYRYIWEPIDLEVGYYFAEYSLEDSDGKLWVGVEDIEVLPFSLTEDVLRILEFTEGNWQIASNQMIFYKRDGSELARFDLTNLFGIPTMSDVFKRTKV